jgi:hypothetical protein
MVRMVLVLGTGGVGIVVGCMVGVLDVGVGVGVVAVESGDDASVAGVMVVVKVDVGDVGDVGFVVGGGELGRSTASPGMRLLTSSHTPSPFSWVLSFLCVRSFSSISFAPPPLPLLPISSLPLLSPVA